MDQFKRWRMYCGICHLHGPQRTQGKVTVKIDGSAISAASVIAMAGDEILMSPTSVMMIHNPLTCAEGEVKDMEKAIEVLTEVKETIINAYAAKTGKPREEISRLMDDETWMGAKKRSTSGLRTAFSGIKTIQTKIP